MRQADLGRAQHARTAGMSGAVIAFLIAAAIVAVIGYYVMAGTGGGHAPTPSTTYAPNATSVPATGAPVPPKVPGYP